MTIKLDGLNLICSDEIDKRPRSVIRYAEYPYWTNAYGLGGWFGGTWSENIPHTIFPFFSIQLPTNLSDERYHAFADEVQALHEKHFAKSGA